MVLAAGLSSKGRRRELSQQPGGLPAGLEEPSCSPHLPTSPPSCSTSSAILLCAHPALGTGLGGRGTERGDRQLSGTATPNLH